MFIHNKPFCFERNKVKVISKFTVSSDKYGGHNNGWNEKVIMDTKCLKIE